MTADSADDQRTSSKRIEVEERALPSHVNIENDLLRNHYANGEYAEKTAVLRMKMNLGSGNPYMWDTIAYRVKFAPHHRTGDKWSKLTHLVRSTGCKS
jgi:glutamyl/glutaminyl-tRNA synthetase